MASNNLLDEMMQATEPSSTNVAINTPLMTPKQSFSDFIDKLNILNVNPLTKKSTKERFDRLSTLTEDIKSGKITWDEAQEYMDADLHKGIKPRNITDLIKLSNIWNKAERPTVAYDSHLLSEIMRGQPSATYSPGTHTMNLPEGKDYSNKQRDKLINEYLAEVSHCLSYTDVGSKGFDERQRKQSPYTGGSIVDLITRLLPKDYQTNIYDKSYSSPGTEEHYAHRIIEPLLDKYMSTSNTKSLDKLFKSLK